MIQQFDGVLPGPDCRRLIQLIDALVAGRAARQGAGRSSATYLFDADLDEAGRALIADGALQACVDSISVEPGQDVDVVYLETIALTALEAGDEIPWHADNCRRDADGRWVSNEYPQRCLSAVLYLNGDFHGGEIVFDQQSMAIRPDEGRLIVFPSGREFTHSVNRVSAGRRYALGIWFTAHRWHALLPQRILVRRRDP